MWIFVKQTGRVELVHNVDHIARLLGEGGTEVEDPRVSHVQEEQALPQEPEQVEQERVPEQEQVSDEHQVIDIGKRRRRAGKRG